MSGVVHEVERTASPPRTDSPDDRRVVLALAGIEARRLLRSPLVWLGLLLTLGSAWVSMRTPDDWSGARYTIAPLLVGPLVATISFAVAGVFHRERVDASGASPVGEETRALGGLLGCLSLVAVVGLLTGAGAVAARAYGGFDLGDEPGRTLRAHFSWAEFLQPVCLALLGVAVGAAAGRRFRHRASATLVLFVGWFPFVMLAWAFGAAAVTPFSIVQIQPVSVEIGPLAADPLSFPASWLLLSPGEFQDHWARAFVSVELAAWHDVWLLGLATVFTGLALPRTPRRALIAVGVVIAAVGVLMQYAVLP